MTDRTWTSPATRITPNRKERLAIFQKTDGRCYKCSCKLSVKGWEAEHPQALELMGPADIEALMPICVPCHKVKTTADRKAMAKCDRIRDKHTGVVKPKSSFQTNRNGPYKAKIGGKVEKRT